MTRRSTHAAFAAVVLFLFFAPLTRAATMSIASLTGEVTAAEVSSFVNFMNTQVPATDDNGNQMADGSTGQDVEACCKLFEVCSAVPALTSQRLAVLNNAIRFCDVMLAHRDDQPLGIHLAMWDGKIDPVWPSPHNEAATYAGVENGDILGHISYTALEILRTPAIWNTLVPDHDPYHYGTTYKARALTYIKMCDVSETNYFLKYWDYSADHKLRYPTDSRWAALNTTGPAGPAGSDVPWNRQGMLCNGFMRLAQCHTVLADNSPLIARYKKIVQVAANSFVVVAYPYVVNTHTVYDWGYVDGSSGTKPSAEQCNVHGDYDIFLLTESYVARYSTAITVGNLARYADTAAYVINLAHDSFGQNVDGGGTAQSYLDPYWLPLCQWNRSLYTTIAQASIDDNRYSSRPVVDAYILYFKHWNFTH